MGEPVSARRTGTRRSFIAGGLAATLGLAACAEKMPAPLPSANGRSLVLGPEPGFNPAAPPADWFVGP
jgi:hypothetical protein